MQKEKSVWISEEGVLALLDSTYRIAEELLALQSKLNWCLVFGGENPGGSKQESMPNQEKPLSSFKSNEVLERKS